MSHQAPLSHAWPLQSEASDFYGPPVFAENKLVHVALPFTMYMGDIVITRIRIHRRCADSLARVVQTVAGAYSHYPAGAALKGAMNRDHASEFSGSYAYRTIRGSRALSMHAYGCAVDIAASVNAHHDLKPFFSAEHPWVRAFEAEGWTWGGRWQNIDAMHFQAARVG